jgi:hypothetical protein
MLLAQSENPHCRCLSWVNLAFLGFGSGIFILTVQERASMLAWPSRSPTPLSDSACSSPPFATPSLPPRSHPRRSRGGRHGWGLEKWGKGPLCEEKRCFRAYE